MKIIVKAIVDGKEVTRVVDSIMGLKQLLDFDDFSLDAPKVVSINTEEE